MAKTRSKVYHLIPYFQQIVGHLLSTNKTIVDSHLIIEEYKTRFPQVYLNGLQLFHGVERSYHSSLAKLIKHSITHTSHIGNVYSLNCKGYVSRNAEWYLS